MSETRRRQFGRSLAELRKIAGHTQGEVAGKLGAAGDTISRLERGQQFASWEMLVGMAELYGVDIVELFRVPMEDRGEGAEVLEEIVGMLDGRSGVDLERVREALRLLLGEK